MNTLGFFTDTIYWILQGNPQNKMPCPGHQILKLIAQLVKPSQLSLSLRSFLESKIPRLHFCLSFLELTVPFLFFLSFFLGPQRLCIPMARLFYPMPSLPSLEAELKEPYRFDRYILEKNTKHRRTTDEGHVSLI